MRGPLLLVDVDAIIEQQQSSPKLDLEIGPPIYDLNEGVDELPAAHSRQSAEPEQAGVQAAGSAGGDSVGLQRVMEPNQAEGESAAAAAGMGGDELATARSSSPLEPKQAANESAAAGARSAAGSGRAWKPEAAGKEAGVAYTKDSLNAAVVLRNGAHADPQLSRAGSSNGSAEGMESNEQRSSNGSRWSQREDVGRAGAAGQSKSAAEDQCAHRRGGTM